jgi:hypothetical protein
MIRKHSLWLLTFIWLPVAGHAQQDPATVPVQIRAVLHDPVHPAAELFYTDKKGLVAKVEFRPQDLTRPLFTLPVNGSVVLYDKADIDPKKPEASLAASVKLPPNIRQAIIIVLPAPAGSKPAYRMVVIDDSAKAFPKGESRVLPLVTVETAIQAGEHRLPVHPGKITSVPPVRKVNEFNMAQTNFYYKQGEAWVPFTERQLQFLDACRRLFIIHVTPGALQPSVTTIVDTAPAAAPR